MEKQEIESVPANVEDISLLSRNRSFKSKQLVRSQAIRETQSPPRTSSPAVGKNNEISDATNVPNEENNMNNNVADEKTVIDNVTNNVRTLSDKTSDVSSQNSDMCSSDVVSYIVNNDFNDYKIKQPVEIQITSGNWDQDIGNTDQRLRAKSWLGQRDPSENSRDLLSNNPRVACVCGNCAACPHCRGRRRRQYCPTKQDSGIVCSDECPDCSDSETAGSNNEGVHKSGSIDGDDQNYYCRCPEKKERPKNTPLTRTDSDERLEPSGPELVSFIKETLNKNGKDRMTLLRIERELHALINDTGRCIVRFPVMTSYGRMLVHRCASLFQLSHHLDQMNKTCVVVSKSGTSGGRIPCTSFKQWCTVNFPPSPQRFQPDSTNAKSILKRDTHSLDESCGGVLPSNRSKSLEQREKEYERVRRRIFSSENCADESQWPWMTGPIKLLTSEAGRNKLLKVQSVETSSPASSGVGNRVKGAVSKSHSFSGRAPDTPPTRLLSRHGDLVSSSWRLSPSSSGYKTLSLRSTDSVTPSPTGGASPEPSLGGISAESVVWAVTDLSSVPAGAVVIHPQTGRPLMNPDGSLYHFDPAHPPVLYDIAYKHEEIKNDNSEKKRGRLEKQHSFIDNDCECQPSEECRSKCCTECRRQESYQPKTTYDKETNTKPSTPVKIQTENVNNEATELTNHNPPFDAAANQKPLEISANHDPLDATANQNATEIAHAYESTNHVQAQEHQNGQRVDMQQCCETYKQEPTNHQPLNEARQSSLTNQESHEMQHYPIAYAQGYTPEEITSPPQATGQFIQPDMSMTPNVAKVAPIAMPDPNIRPMSLSNVLYPTAMPQPYPYLGQGRVDPALQPAMYQGMMTAEDMNKLVPSPHTNENTFRIDPSYPYGAIEYTAAGCGTCVETNALQHPHRSYNVPYNQMEMQQVLQPTYPIGNVLLPQHHMQPYTYQDQGQWPTVQPGVPQKLILPDIYPLVQYPTTYPQYNLVYPQVLPQPYAVCQPMYPIVDNKREQDSIPARSNFRNNRSGSFAHGTPVQTPPPVYHNHGPRRNDNNEIAVKIQQIKEQMAQLNTKDKEKDKKKEDWKKDEFKRKSGNGLLGNYPNSNFNERHAHGRTPNDESQLSNEARVIVNSIRSMQSKNTYHNEGRALPSRSPRGRGMPRDHNDVPHPRHSFPHPRHSGPDWHQNGGGRNRPLNPLSSGVYRPPYLFRQMSPNTWCRRSPGPVHPVLNNPRRPHPDSRNGGRR